MNIFAGLEIIDRGYVYVCSATSKESEVDTQMHKLIKLMVKVVNAVKQNLLLQVLLKLTFHYIIPKTP